MKSLVIKNWQLTSGAGNSATRLGTVRLGLQENLDDVLTWRFPDKTLTGR